MEPVSHGARQLGIQLGVTPKKKAGRVPKAKAIDGQDGSAKKKRDHKQEALAAQQGLFEGMLAYGEQRRAGEYGQLLQIAQALILCGLPYRRTDASRHERVSRAADGTMTRITFHALGKDEEGNPIPMAFGSDRTYLHWAIDKAIKRQDPFVPLGTGIEYMRDLGQKPSGQNYKRLRDAHRRLASLAITVERYDKKGEAIAILPIIEAANLPYSIVPGTLPITGTAGLRFSQRFFMEFKQNCVPFPLDLIRVLDLKPQMQDLIVFLHWRTFAARQPSIIPWDKLREQIWQEDKNQARIRFRFAQAIKLFKAAWPELTATADPAGLHIRPLKEGRHLLPSGGR